MRPREPGKESAPARTGLRALGQEFAKFGTVGGLGIFVNLAVFNLCRGLTGLPVVRCSVIATVVAIAFNYLGLRHFAYRDRARARGRRSREVLLFAAFSAAGLIVENGVLYVATYGFGLHTPFESNAFKFLGIGTATLFRFWSYRVWVFRALPGLPHGAAPHGDPSNTTSSPAAYQPETTAPPP